MKNTENISVSFMLNDSPQTISVNPLRRFSEVLREDLGLTGTKVGCDAGDCGACTIQIDGEQHNACLTAAAQLEGRSVLTVEGLSNNGNLSPLQQAFLDEGAAQCGICTPGFLVAAKGLLDNEPSPSEGRIRHWLAGNLCRCTGYDKIIRAVQKASS